MRSLEVRQQELEQSNKELTSHKFHLEAVGRETEAKLTSAEAVSVVVIAEGLGMARVGLIKQ